MGGIRPEEATTVGPDLLDGRQRSHRAATDGLGVHLGRGAVEWRCFDRPLEGHRHSVGHQQERQDHTQRDEDEYQDPHQVDVEVAHGLVAAQRPDHGQHDGQSRGGGNELQPDDPAHLTEVTEVLLAGVMLEIGVGHERADGVEDDAGIGTGVVNARGVLVAESPQRALSIGVQREVLLGVEQAEGQDEQGEVKRQEGEGVPFPVHFRRLAATEQTAEEHRQGVESPAHAVGGRIERAEHRPPDREG